jgi:hypothetical protein
MDQVVNLAREMRAKYLGSLIGNVEPLPINTVKLANFISSETGIEIESCIVPDLNELRGLLIRRSPKNALVLIADSPTNNPCWQRFTFIKEVSHLFVETPDSFSSDAWEQARVLVDREYMRSSGDNQQRFAYEICGVVAAIELLIPHEMKGRIAHMRNVEGKSNWAVASYFKVPEKFIEFRLREWGLVSP